MRILFPAIAVGAVALVAACTSYAPAPAGTAEASAYGGRQCFYAPNVTGFRKGLTPDSIVVNTNSRDYYAFRTQQYCADRLDWRQAIALRSRTGTFICNGYDAEIYVPEAVTALYCPLYDMHKLSPQEVTALRGEKPKY